MGDLDFLDEKEFQRMYSRLKTEYIETEMVLKEARSKMRESQQLALEAEFLINYACHQLSSAVVEGENLEKAETSEEVLEVKKQIFERVFKGIDGIGTCFKKEE